MPGMATAGSSDGAVAAALVAKAALAAAVALAVIAFAVGGRSFARASLLGGAAAGIGCAAFDACTGYHAAALAPGGDCHCLSTALLAALAALVCGGALLTRRALAAAALRAIRAAIARIVRPVRLRGEPRLRRRPGRDVPTFHPPRRARRFAGRAPPLR